MKANVFVILLSLAAIFILLASIFHWSGNSSQKISSDFSSRFHDKDAVIQDLIKVKWKYDHAFIFDFKILLYLGPTSTK